ncbi:MAG TPA: nuclear transport factor 2 family protein [Solirubrobacteraceae bacterium]|nr:nuclear transport factor 2 family protein [Solirubrobacteraceae bacterium]
MAEESTTPDLAQRARTSLEALNRRDFDALLPYAARDVVYDTSPSGFRVYKGVAAIRDFIEGYWRALEDLRFELEGFHDLGNGVTFAVNLQHARPMGSTAPVQARKAHSPSGRTSWSCA